MKEFILQIGKIMTTQALRINVPLGTETSKTDLLLKILMLMYLVLLGSHFKIVGFSGGCRTT